MTRAHRAVAAALLVLAVAAGPAAAAPADLDPTFGGDGIVTAAPGSQASLRALALSGDDVVGAGSAIVGCRSVALARWDEDGSPDAAFGTGGAAVTPVGHGCDNPDDVVTTGFALSLVAAPGGGLFTGGGSFQGSSRGGDEGLLTGHAPAGALDPAFSGDGWLREEFEGGAITGLARLADGRLVAGGYTYGVGHYSWEIRRYLPGGGPDSSFGSGGKADSSGIANGPVRVLSALVLDGADGAVVVAGDVLRQGDDGLVDGLAIGRIRADGSRDPGFGTGGGTRVELPGESASAADVVRTPDGGFVVAGSVSSSEGGPRWLLLKFDSEGRLDDTFGAGGRVDGPAGSAAAVAVDQAGRLVVAGGSTVARFLVNGAPDASFGTGGAVQLPLTPDPHVFPLLGDVLVDAEGRIVAGGTTHLGGRSVMTVVRLRGGDAGTGTGSDDGEIAEPGRPGGGPGGNGQPGGDGPVVGGPVPNRQSGGRVTIRILSPRVNASGVLVRATWPRGTDGTARARLWTRNKGILLGQRSVAARRGTTGRTFRVPLNRRAKRLLRSGKPLKITATLRVTGLPAR